MIDLVVRLGRLADAETLAHFNELMAWETEHLELDRERIRAGVKQVLAEPAKGFYLVAESNGAIAGQLMVTYEWSDWRNKWFWWIQSVYILPEGRGQKLYSRMYTFVKERAAEAGNVCGFRLYVETENTHAQKVYEALGMASSHYLMFEEEV